MFDDFDVIHRYTRAQAIQDGVLVDLGKGDLANLSREAGIRFPVAMTAGAWAKTVGGLDDPLPAGQSIEGRVWDVLMVFRYAAKAQGGSRCDFEVRVWGGTRQEVVKLWALCGPGDNAEPVITIMLAGED